MTIQELMELHAKTWDEARNFLDSKRNDSGVLSEEDSKTYDEMEKKIADLGKEIERISEYFAGQKMMQSARKKLSNYG